MSPRAWTGAKSAATEVPARPELPREFVAAHKRRRIINAVAELAAEQGYESTKIADIVRRAGVARKTLYDNFDGKEEVFLAAFDATLEEMIARVEAECAKVDEDEWEARVRAGLEAFLGYVGEEPSLARLCLVEAISATPAAGERYEEAMQRFVAMARDTLPIDGGQPETIDESLIGGVSWIVQQQLRRGEGADAQALLPELTDFLLTPFLDAAGAT